MPRAKASKWKKCECRHCDGCGWTEGGKVIRTVCTECNGKGWYRGDPRTGLKLSTKGNGKPTGRQRRTDLANALKALDYYIESAHQNIQSDYLINLIQTRYYINCVRSRMLSIRSEILDWSEFCDPTPSNTSLPRELR